MDILGQMSSKMDPFSRIEAAANFVDKKTATSIRTKLKRVDEEVKSIERSSGLTYPPYYVEPVLRVVESGDNTGGLGVLYARTIPVDVNGSITIVVELSAPLVLYGTKRVLRIILAHELLHYLELVRRFVRMDISSQITSSSIMEEQYQDNSRVIDPSIVFKDKRLISQLRKEHLEGFTEERLNEKCKSKWIERGLPVQKMPIGANQVSVSPESIIKTSFDHKAVDLVSGI